MYMYVAYYYSYMALSPRRPWLHEIFPYLAELSLRTHIAQQRQSDEWYGHRLKTHHVGTKKLNGREYAEFNCTQRLVFNF